MASPFLLNPEHQAVLDGDRSALDVQRSGGRLFVGLVGAAIFGLLVLGMLGVLGRYLAQEARYASAGTLTEAEILDREAFIDPEDPDDIKDATWSLTYRFEAGGETITQRQQVRSTTYEATEDLTTVPVRYIPANPQVSRVVAGESERFNTGGVVALSGGVVIFGGVGVIFARQAQRGLQEPATLRAEGRPIEGVLRRARGSGASREAYRVAMAAAFTSPQSGQRITITAEAPRPDLYGAELPASGTPIVVWYVDDELYQVL